MKTKIHVLDHPIIQEELTKLRDKRTDQVTFRKCLARIGGLAGYEIACTMGTRKIKINTPIAGAQGVEVPDKANVVIITVLRAAIPLTEGLYKIFPAARAGVVSASRGPAPKFEIKMDYVKVPPIRRADTLIVSDPMLATGSTLCRVMKELKRFGKPKRLIILSVIAANEGIRRVAGQFPSAEFFACAVDRKLNSHGYIVPGLGDAGDRAFGV